MDKETTMKTSDPIKMDFIKHDIELESGYDAIEVKMPKAYNLVTDSMKQMLGVDAKELGISVEVSKKNQSGEVLEQTRNNVVGSETFFGPDSSSLRRLSSSTLRKMYAWSSYARPAVDSIARTVSSIDWTIVSRNGKKLRRREKEAKDKIIEFFDNPNSNKDTFKQIIQMFITDILVLDAGCFEKVRNTDGQLVEINPVDGASIRIVADEKGNIDKFVQVSGSGGKVKGAEWTLEDFVYKQLFPRTYSIYGFPILESITIEIEAMLNAIDNESADLSRAELPDGVLILKKIGGSAYDRFVEDIRNRNMRGVLKVLRNVEDAKWIPFDRSNTEKDTVNIMDRIEKIIWRNFGLSPAEMGGSEGLNRATADIQVKLGKSRLIKPLIQLLSECINDEIISEFNNTNNLKFKFIFADENDIKTLSDSLNPFTKTGILSINESRRIIEDVFGVEDIFNPIKNGDKHYIQLGNRVFEVESQTILENIVLNDVTSDDVKNLKKLSSERVNGK